MRRRTHRQLSRVNYDTPAWREYVTTGSGEICHFGLDNAPRIPEGVPNARRSELREEQLREQLAAAWQQLRAAILPVWIKQQPGTRPHAEWEVVLIPQHGYRQQIDEPYCQLFTDWESLPDGSGVISRGGFGVPRVCHGFDDNPLFETEENYLRRYGLLTKPEAAELAA